MFSISHLLAQAQQTQKLPWGFLVLFGLLAVAAVGLLIYFLTRVRKSEKEAEDDWGLAGRGILLSQATSIVPAPEKKRDVAPETSLPPTRAEPPPPVPPAPETAQPRLTSESQVPLEPQPDTVAKTERIEGPVDVPELAKAPEILKGAEIVPPPPETHAAELHYESVAQAEPEFEKTDQGSPFDEEVWSQLESQQQTAVVGQPELIAPAVAFTSDKEPYEPPRIAPIVPNKEPVLKAAPIVPKEEPVQKAQPVQQTPAPVEVNRPLSASQRYSANPSRLEARPSVSRKPAAAAAGSILGLPAEATAGPFVIDRTRARQDAGEVGTLANYDSAPDDAAGHSGTIVLVIVVVLVAACLGAYFGLPSVHSRVNSWVARVRGIQEPAKSVAQVFPSTLDESKDPALARGTLQNISDQPLSGLSVVISLDPRGGGTAVTQDVPVTPDEIQPGQQGAYEFPIERNKYRSYKVVGLKGKNGATLSYDKANQQQ